MGDELSMRVHYMAPSQLNGQPRPMLIMQPDSGRDRETLEKLASSESVAGIGRDAETMAIDHLDLWID